MNQSQAIFCRLGLSTTKWVSFSSDCIKKRKKETKICRTNRPSSSTWAPFQALALEPFLRWNTFHLSSCFMNLPFSPLGCCLIFSSAHMRGPGGDIFLVLLLLYMSYYIFNVVKEDTYKGSIPQHWSRPASVELTSSKFPCLIWLTEVDISGQQVRSLDFLLCLVVNTRYSTLRRIRKCQAKLGIWSD